MKFINPEIEAYAINHSTRPSDACKKLELHTREVEPMSRMLIGEMEGSLMATLIKLSRAERILEIGTFTGYSALVMAEALPPNGEIITLDIEQKEYTQSFWDQSPHGSKIHFIKGAALESISSLKGTFDLIFIDADKTNYLNYLQKTLPLLSNHGAFVIDNVLWSGKVLLPASSDDASTAALQEFNDWVSARSDLRVTMLPVRDGVSLIQRSTF